MDDWPLVEAYARSGSQAAFGELVSRHVDMIYAVCCRHLKDAHLAEDAAQAVFVILARKAASIPRSVALVGWLHTTARHVCANAIRAAAARRRHESSAAIAASARQAPGPSNDGAAHAAAAGVDEALARLRPVDRDAILLRYLEGRTLEDVGRALGVSPDAARKRIERALTQLRAMLDPVGGQGASSVAAVGPYLVSLAARAPEGLASSAAPVALAAPPASAAMSLAKGAVIMAALSKAKSAAAVVVVAILLAGLSLAPLFWPGSGTARRRIAQTPAPPSTATSTPPQATHPTDSVTALAWTPPAQLAAEQPQGGQAICAGCHAMQATPAITWEPANTTFLHTVSFDRIHVAAGASSTLSADLALRAPIAPGGTVVSWREDDHLLFMRIVGKRPTYLLALSRTDGRFVYDGPVVTDEQKASVPAEIAEQFVLLVARPELATEFGAAATAPRQDRTQAPAEPAPARVVSSIQKDCLMLARVENGRIVYAFAFDAADGRVLFEGPAAAVREREAMPRAVAEQLEVLEKNHRQTSDFGLLVP
jgi:RNA polymerase sigma factor (sigma-70 family)